MRVVVVGAGIGGLCLAHALRRRGTEVVLVERDSDLAETGGYRLHLGPQACHVLERELPAEVWTALLAAGAGAAAFRAMHVTDRRLRLLVRVPAEAGRHLLVGRVPLRRTLGLGLEGVLRLGRTARGYERHGQVLGVRLDDGSIVEGDVVVAADGVGSVVARQAAGRATSRAIGLVGLAGRVEGEGPLPDAPALLRDGPLLAVGPHGVGMFVTRHDPSTATVDPAACPVAPFLEPPGWVWGLILSRAEGDRALPDPSEACRRTRGWSPWARDLVLRTPPAALGTYRFHAADPSLAVVPWQARDVTALGDAVHAMPPTGGRSASTAIEDAGDLAEALQHVVEGRVGLAAALEGYHRSMSERAGHRVRESLAPARWISRSDGPVGSATLLASTAALATARRLVGRGAR